MSDSPITVSSSISSTDTGSTYVAPTPATTRATRGLSICRTHSTGDLFIAAKRKNSQSSIPRLFSTHVPHLSDSPQVRVIYMYNLTRKQLFTNQFM